MGATSLVAQSEEARDKVPKCILIVDDHEHIRKLVRAFLESEAAFEVCGEAVDGFDAIQKAQALKPDLIILDLSMPRMGGVEAAQRLKKFLPQTPIVLFTWHGTLSVAHCSSSRAPRSALRELL